MKKGKRCENCGEWIPAGYKVPDNEDGNCVAGGTHHHLESVNCLRCNDNGCPACNGTKGSKYNPEPY